MNLVWLKLIKRILTHKYYVAKYCFQIGLYWQGITHDLSKELLGKCQVCITGDEPINLVANL